jgi:uncharacterized protein (TIGR03083 family)
MNDAEYLASFARDTEALAAVVEQGLAPTVPACPGWTVGDLAFHVGAVHRFWTRIVAEQLQEPPEWTPVHPPDEELAGWLRDGVAPLVEAVERTDPATPIWTWSLRRDAGFVPRRMAQETAVHRWDGEAAVGTPRPIDARLAVDGIEELLELVMPFGAAGYDGPPIDAHLHSTDIHGEWVVHVDDGTLTVERTHAKQPVAIRGTASDLLLLLWRRVPLDAVEVFGDEPTAHRLISLTDMG